MWNSAKLFVLENYTTVADRNVPLIGKTLRYFQYTLRSSTYPHVVKLKSQVKITRA